MSLKTIFCFLFLKYHCKKNSQFQNCSIKTCKDKNIYYHSFKTQLDGRYKTKPELLVEAQVMGRVDSNQYRNKNNYYHRFKARFESRFGVRPNSRVRLTIDSSQREDKNSYYYSFKTRLGVRSVTCQEC